VRIRACGVRGSTPVFGERFSRVGGHTSCLAVSVDDELPTLVLDAGTGLQDLALEFDGAPFDGTILLTHLHWDHVQGIPFFPPADQDEARVVCAQPAQGDPVAVMARAMSPPHFPIGPMDFRGSWTHVALDAGTHELGKFTVLALDVHHKGGRTFGYRVTCDGASFAYVPDALDANDDAIVELAAGADVLLRGTPFVTAEQERADLFGHGTVEHAVEIAKRARVRALVLTHHSPFRTDDEVEAIAERAGVIAATEGMIIEI
jgi:phosphoribosyl 1,2-cyclic phosphodiesterase